MALLYCFLNGEVSVCPHPNPGHHSGHRATPRLPQSHTWAQGQFPHPLPSQSHPLGAAWCPWVPALPVVLVQVQAEIRRNWSKWQRSMESNVFNLATQDFTA